MSSIIKNKCDQNYFLSNGKLISTLSAIFLFVGALTIFQDFLESKRSSIEFNLDESILFKLVWFMFIPISAILYKRLKNDRLDNYSKISVYIISATIAHSLVLPIIGTLFSITFYEGRYDFFKFFTYTMAHDLYKLVVIYSSFVIAYMLFSKRFHAIDTKGNRPTLNTLVINNGKDNEIIKIEDIVQITSATPYIFIHLEGKKYLHSETLKSIIDKLNSDLLVRVHKSVIVNILKVSSFKSRLNGDYDLHMRTGEIVRLSRNYVSEFKSRLNTKPQVKL